MSKKTINIFCCRECPLKKQDNAEIYDPDYANINGIRLARRNEQLAFCEHFTYNEAMRLFNGASGKRLPTKNEWEQMLAAGYTWDSEKKGIWVGMQHTECRETARSTFLPAAGYRYYRDSSLNNAGTHGHYWSSTVIGDKCSTLSFYSGDVDPNLCGYSSSGRPCRCLVE